MERLHPDSFDFLVNGKFTTVESKSRCYRGSSSVPKKEQQSTPLDFNEIYRTF